MFVETLRLGTAPERIPLRRATTVGIVLRSIWPRTVHGPSCQVFSRAEVLNFGIARTLGRVDGVGCDERTILVCCAYNLDHTHTSVFARNFSHCPRRLFQRSVQTRGGFLCCRTYIEHMPKFLLRSGKTLMEVRRCACNPTKSRVQSRPCWMWYKAKLEESCDQRWKR